MKFNFSATVSRLCAACLAFLGYSCSSEEVMYGPMVSIWDASWKISGSVTDQNGNVVSDASVRLANPDYSSNMFYYEETNVNSEGNYVVERESFMDKVKVICYPDDPALSADSTTVELKYVKDLEATNEKFLGHAEAIVNFKLKPKTDDNKK